MDLTPRLSRGLKVRQYNDKMLHDWGIYHLHLGAALEGDGFMERSGNLLFVMCRPDDLYLLDVRPHRHDGAGVWVDDDLVDIIHSNWPEAIARFRFDALRSAHALTREQRALLRSKNGNAGVYTRDGTFYAGIGGGLVGSGSNIRAIMWADRTLETAKALEASTTMWNGDEIADEVAMVTGVRPDRLVLRLGLVAEDHALIIIENAAKPFVIKVRFSD